MMGFNELIHFYFPKIRKLDLEKSENQVIDIAPQLILSTTEKDER